MNRLLVFCYFCPSAEFRGGGVQQVVGNLLDGLATLAGWEIEVVHYGRCAASDRHTVLANPSPYDGSDCVAPSLLCDVADALRTMGKHADVVLSVDRLMAVSGRTPCVLMANTAAYVCEASAVLGGEWTAVVVPTHHFAWRVRSMNPSANVVVIPYGLPASDIKRAVEMPSPDWNARPLVARLAHRPDPRKGHVAAIRGLMEEGTAMPAVSLDVAWLDEARYVAFRETLDGLVKQFGLEDRVRFSGWANGDERWRALTRSHAIIQVGGFEETFGLAAVEAVLAGRVVISLRQPAIQEVLSSPLHVEVDDPRAWRKALGHVGPRVVENRTRMSRRLVRALDLERMVMGYDEALRAAAEGRKL